MSAKVRAGIVFFAIAFVGSFALGALGLRGFSAWFVPFLFGALAGFVVLMLSGNRPVRNGSAADRDEALRAMPATGQAFVYVYRNNFLGMAAGMNVTVDGQTLVQLKSPRFTRIVLPAGHHLLAADLSGFAATQNKGTSLPVGLAPGQVLFVHLRNEMGMLKNALLLVPEPDSPALRGRLAGMRFVLPNPFDTMGTSGVAAPPLAI